MNERVYLEFTKLIPKNIVDSSQFENLVIRAKGPGPFPYALEIAVSGFDAKMYLSAAFCNQRCLSQN